MGMRRGCPSLGKGKRLYLPSKGSLAKIVTVESESVECVRHQGEILH